MKLAKKCILITGGNRGIGAQMVLDMLEKFEQFDVLFTCRSLEDGQNYIDSLVRKRPHYKERLETLVLDISKNDSISTFYENVKQRNKKIDVLYNNSGIFIRTGRSSDANPSYDVCKDTLATNFYGTFEFTRKMQELISENGKLIFVGSALGRAAYNQCSDPIKRRFADKTNNLQQIMEFSEEY